MPYSPENNPYIPGDPYSYDLKWIVARLKKMVAPEEAALRAEAAAAEAEKAASIITSFVSPDMFGAVGNGVHDDTEAFQKAVDSGKPVCLLQNKSYLLKDTIVMKAGASDSRLIFSLANSINSRLAQVVCDFDDNSKPIFNILEDGYMFMNVTINAINNENKDLTVFQLRREVVTPDLGTPYYPVDVDFTLFNCSIFNADKCFNFTGRGLNVLNNLIARCNYIADIAWPGDEGDSGGVWHDDDTGMRGIRFENNRFHSIGGSGGSLANTWSAIHVTSGNCYGFRFVGNIFDRGDCQLIAAEEDIDNWLISDNTFSGMRGGDAFFWAKADVNRLVFSDNIFTIPQASSTYNLVYVIRIFGNLTDSIISGNTIEQIRNGTFLWIKGNEDPTPFPMANCIISDNIISRVAANSISRGMIHVPAGSTIERCVITGNIVGYVTGGSSDYTILRVPGTAYLNYVVMQDNVPYSSYDQDYVLNACEADHCKFDFPVGAETTLTDTTVGYIPTP